jgi:ABC-type nitrate/sulfonate/bicarbonate transport system permease component
VVPPHVAALARAPGRLLPRLGVGFWRLVTLLVFLGLWHLASLLVGELLLPSPIAVAAASVDLARSGQLARAVLESLLVFAGGYGLAVVSGVAIGLVMGALRPLGETLEIYVNGINSTPRVAFIPLIVLWLGLGDEAKIAVVWFTAVFPIIINTYAGVLNSDPELIETARSFGARRGQVVRYIVVPAAVPYMIAGLRIGASLAIIGTVVAELYTALSGLGYLLAQFGNTFQTAKYFVPVVVLVAVGMAISQSLKLLERRLAHWKTTKLEL